MVVETHAVMFDAFGHLEQLMQIEFHAAFPLL